MFWWYQFWCFLGDICAVKLVSPWLRCGIMMIYPSKGKWPCPSGFLVKSMAAFLSYVMSVMTAKISATNIYGVNFVCLYYTFLCNITLPWCRRYIETQCTKLNVQHWLLLTNMSANDKWVQTFRQEIHIFIWTGDMILHV